MSLCPKGLERSERKQFQGLYLHKNKILLHSEVYSHLQELRKKTCLVGKNWVYGFSFISPVFVKNIIVTIYFFCMLQILYKRFLYQKSSIDIKENKYGRGM